MKVQNLQQHELTLIRCKQYEILSETAGVLPYNKSVKIEHYLHVLELRGLSEGRVARGERVRVRVRAGQGAQVLERDTALVCTRVAGQRARPAREAHWWWYTRRRSLEYYIRINFLGMRH